MPHAVESVQAGGPNWLTPDPLAEDIIGRYRLDYDAFADHANALAPLYSTIEGTFRKCPPDWGPHVHHEDGVTTVAYALAPEDRCGGVVKVSDRDGFSEPWSDRGVFLNPPYATGFAPRVMAKCVREARNPGTFHGEPIRPARIVVGLFLCDTSTKVWREVVIPNAESIEYLPRVQYELPPDDLAAWRESCVQREAKKLATVGDSDFERLREQFAEKVPGSPNFGSAVVVFKGPGYRVRAVSTGKGE